MPEFMVGHGTMELHFVMAVEIIGNQRIRGQVGGLIYYRQSRHNYQNKPQR